MVPNEATFVESALRSAGQDVCLSPYLPHALFSWFMRFLPESLITRRSHGK